MTAADWAILIPAVAGLLSGVGAWLKFRSHASNPNAHQ